MLVIENHRAAARRNLGKPIGQHRRDQAYVNRKGGIYMFVQDFSYFGQFALSYSLFWQTRLRNCEAALDSTQGVRTCERIDGMSIGRIPLLTRRGIRPHGTVW